MESCLKLSNIFLPIVYYLFLKYCRNRYVSLYYLEGYIVDMPNLWSLSFKFAENLMSSVSSIAWAVFAALWLYGEFCNVKLMTP